MRQAIWRIFHNALPREPGASPSLGFFRKYASQAIETTPIAPEGTKAGPIAAAMFVPGVVCAALAYWQYERSIWKDELIVTRTSSLKEPAKSVYDLDELQDYTKVSCSGRFIHDRSIFVGPRPRNVPGRGVQSGYFLITPLYDASRKGAVLVNRGWVPTSWYNDIESIKEAHDALPLDAPQDTPPTAAADAASTSSIQSGSSGSKHEGQGWFSWLSGKKKASSQPYDKETNESKPSDARSQPDVTVVGVLQPSETPSAAIPNNIPEDLIFHWVDVPALATAVGLPEDTPLIQCISEDPATQQQHQRTNPVQQRRKQGYTGPVDFPLPKNTYDLVHFATMPMDHINYALTWASLAVILTYMARKVVVNPPKVVKIAGGHSNKDIWSSVHSKTK